MQTDKATAARRVVDRKRQLGYRIYHSDLERLHKLAQGRPISRIIDAAIAEYLARHDPRP
jgi:hypothetical protein